MIADIVITTWFIEISTIIVLSGLSGFLLGVGLTISKK